MYTCVLVSELHRQNDKQLQTMVTETERGHVGADLCEITKMQKRENASEEMPCTTFKPVDAEGRAGKA